MLPNPQIAAAREVVDRYAGTGRVLTHTIVHPNLGPARARRDGRLARRARPSGWKCYTLYGPPTTASPTGGWFLDDDEIGMPFLERVRRVGPQRRRGAQGPRRTDPRRRRSPRRRRATSDRPRPRSPTSTSSCTTPATNAIPTARRVPTTRRRRPGVDRLIKSLADAGDRARRQRVRRAREHVVPHAAPAGRGRARARQAARALGPERIVWGTDSTWYGSPQPLIDAFRAFRIPERMQEEYGYPPLTAETKEKILSVNARVALRRRRRRRRARRRRSHARLGGDAARRPSPTRSPRGGSPVSTRSVSRYSQPHVLATSKRISWSVTSATNSSRELEAVRGLAARRAR